MRRGAVIQYGATGLFAAAAVAITGAGEVSWGGTFVLSVANSCRACPSAPSAC